MLATMKRTVGAVLALIALLACVSPGALAADANEDRLNRYNVVLVLDASGSMNSSDPHNLRFEAIKEFLYLLTEKGNHVGAVVFSNDVSAQKAVVEMDSRNKKDAVIAALEEVPASGWTNIGSALDTAVDMLEQGDPNLPSVILFLSDGNTEMPSTKELDASIEQKAEAIDRARKKGIEIFSVCLNANHSADVSEMQQISAATSAKFEEVTNAKDLFNVLNSFYSMIYGTSSIQIGEAHFDANEMLEKEFVVPGVGVEEINIIIEGSIKSAELYRPNGARSDSAEVYSSKTFAVIKEPNSEAGTWKLVAKGNPNDSVFINLRYNSNLQIELEQEPQKADFHTGDALTVRARLRSGSVAATSADQYRGYEAELILWDKFNNVEAQRVKMGLSGASFEQTLELANGAYTYYVAVTGNSLYKTSEEVGPIRVTTPAQTDAPPPPPEPPVAKEEQVNIKKYLWPFMDNSLRIDFAPLATDPKNLELAYHVESSAFNADEYAVDDAGLTQTGYSLRKGSHIIRATNTDGMYCDIEVVVTSVHIGIITAILLGVAAVLTLAVFGILAYIASTKAFGGSIECSVGGDKITRNPKRGKLGLSAFSSLPDCGIDYRKCHFQASGDRYITLISKTPLYHGGKQEKEITINSGRPEIVKSGANGKPLTITFMSRKTVRGRGGRSRGSTPTPPPRRGAGRPGRS